MEKSIPQNRVFDNVDPFSGLSDEELDYLVAEAAGLNLSVILGGEQGWVDSEGVLVHLKSEFSPTSKMNFALDLFWQIAEDNNGLAINTCDPITLESAISIGGFNKSSDNTVQLPFVRINTNDEDGFGGFRKALMRAICSFFVLYKREGNSECE
jgi:hypothetical protein